MAKNVEKKKSKKASSSLAALAKHVGPPPSVCYRALFEQSVDPMVVLDAKGNFVEFNTAAHENLGYTRDEFATMRVSGIEDMESPQQTLKHIANIAKNGFDRFETRHKTKSGEILHVFVTTQAVFEDGKQFLVSMWHDLTEYGEAVQALEEKNAVLVEILTRVHRAEAMFEQSSDSIFIVDEAGALLDFNTAAHEALGYTRDEYDKLDRAAILVDWSPSEAREHFLQVFGDEGYSEFQAKHRCKNGDVRDFDITARRITTDAEAFMVVRCHDITEQNRAKEAMAQKNVALLEMVDQIQGAKDEVGQHVRDNLEKVVLPMLEDIAVDVRPHGQARLAAIKASLEEILLPFATRLSGDRGLTPRELHICRLIRSGSSTKQIAELEHLAPVTVSKHRENIRLKLGIQGQDVNLASYLDDLFGDQPAS